MNPRLPPMAGRRVDSAGYVVLKYWGHPRADVDGRVFEHVLLAEKALGKPLPPGAQVHHFDGVKSNNAPGNLVLCQDQAYHRLLHTRRAAVIACGNPSWRKCAYCHEHDAIENMIEHRRRPGRAMHYAHRKCRVAYHRSRYLARSA